MKLLITRPKVFNDVLAQKLRALRYDVVNLPTIEITPILPLPEKAIKTLQQLSPRDIVIFSSQPAVEWGLPALKHHWPLWPAPLTWVAMGPSTAQALNAYGINNVIYGQTPPYGSESLLAHPLFNTQLLQKITLIKGVDGRTYLIENLEKKGALVSTLDVYKRQKPVITQHFMQTLEDFIKDNTPQKAAISTSLEGLQHLMSIAEETGEATTFNLKAIPIIVVGQRMQSFANDLGFKKVVLATSATDPSIINTVQTLEG